MPKPQIKPNMAEILSSQWDGRQSNETRWHAQYSSTKRLSQTKQKWGWHPRLSSDFHTCATHMCISTQSNAQVHITYTSCFLKGRASYRLQSGMQASRILRQMSFLTWILGVHTLCPITGRRWSSVQRHFECSFRIVVSWAFPRLKQCGFPIAC